MLEYQSQFHGFKRLFSGEDEEDNSKSSENTPTKYLAQDIMLRLL